ncbi:hypothetical protein MRB53_039561 [Persea americana]|nr:hypothetical protein MRB53_039561 [Persea americana]
MRISVLSFLQLFSLSKSARGDANDDENDEVSKLGLVMASSRMDLPLLYLIDKHMPRDTSEHDPCAKASICLSP